MGQSNPLIYPDPLNELKGITKYSTSKPGWTQGRKLKTLHSEDSFSYLVAVT